MAAESMRVVFIQWESAVCKEEMRQNLEHWDTGTRQERDASSRDEWETEIILAPVGQA